MRSLAAFFSLALFAGPAAAEPRIAFEKEDAIYVANADVTTTKKVAEGIFPALSPDGARLAFTKVEKSGTTYVRHIAVVEIATGKTDVFKDVPSDNVYYPAWSPDGKSILFTLRKDELWHLGMIKADGTGFKFIKKGAQNEVTLYSPCWARDGESIFCQDMTNIYQVRLDGSVQAQWKIERIVPNGNMSGDGRIDVSPDGKRLLLSIDMGEEHNRRDWDGPPPALWSFDLSTQRSVRLTAKSLFAWDGCWLDDTTLLFLSQPEGEKTPSLYRIATNGKSLKRLIKGARMPSVSP